MRFWSAAALLAGSWLLGLDFYRPASAVAWTLSVVFGAGLLAGCPLRIPRTRESILAGAMLLPAVWFFPWPYRAAPSLLVIGLVLCNARIPKRTSGATAGLPSSAESTVGQANRDTRHFRSGGALGRGALAAGLVLLAQSLLVELYIAGTARCHELPSFLASLVGGGAWLLGLDAAVDGSTLTLGTLRGPLRLGVTWELVFDPATLAFLVAGLVLLAIGVRRAATEESRFARWRRGAYRLIGVIGVWLPVRTGLLLALLVHRAIRWDAAEPLNVMDQFFSPWLHLVLLAPPALATWCVVRPQGPAAGAEGEDHASERLIPTRLRMGAASLGMVFAATALLAWVWQWEPVGSRLGGRIMVVERHSTWEPTTRPYDTASYGEQSSYTYAAIYDYLSRYYEMSRLLESDAINEAKLTGCDVLVVKTPTSRFQPDEIAAILRFVAGGGRLLLIGEHTDVFKSSSYANDLARLFGFKFRLDLLFRIGNPYVQVYEPPRVPHPIVQYVPRMRFAVSCSVDPGRSSGRAAVLNTGLWSLPPEYHTENYFPEAEYRPTMRCGAFVQLWTTCYGEGRVAAWTDSTIFSNFSTFEPGKPELLLGMLEWLNHRSVLDCTGPWWTVLGVLTLLAVASMAVGLFVAVRQGIGSIVLVASGLFGVVAGSSLVIVVHRHAMPVPEPVRPMVRVVVDRTASDVPLGRGGFTQEDGLGYGLLEQWIGRLGYFTARESGMAALRGDVLVVLCPQKSVSDEFREGVREFVAQGGKLLVLDSPDVVGSTANSLLWQFGLGVNHAASRAGKLGLRDGWPGIPVQAVCEVIGGDAFMWVEGLPVGTRTSFGKGRVMALGFGSLMNDNGLGGHWMAGATPEMLLRSDLLFALVRSLVEDRPVDSPPPRERAGDKPAQEKPSAAK